MAQLLKTQLQNGKFFAQVAGVTDGNAIGLMYENTRLPVEAASQTDHDHWAVEINIPASALSDGVHSFVVVDGSGDKLGQFAIIAGDLADSDIRAELDLLRAELDMLKTAFRRHCVETMG